MSQISFVCALAQAGLCHWQARSGCAKMLRRLSRLASSSSPGFGASQLSPRLLKDCRFALGYSTRRATAKGLSEQIPPRPRPWSSERRKGRSGEWCTEAVFRMRYRGRLSWEDAEVERRRDSDGRLYTLSEFEAFYDPDGRAPEEARARWAAARHWERHTTFAIKQESSVRRLLEVYAACPRDAWNEARPPPPPSPCPPPTSHHPPAVHLSLMCTGAPDSPLAQAEDARRRQAAAPPPGGAGASAITRPAG